MPTPGVAGALPCLIHVAKLEPKLLSPDFCSLVLPLPTLSFTKAACELLKPTESVSLLHSTLS